MLRNDVGKGVRLGAGAALARWPGSPVQHRLPGTHPHGTSPLLTWQLSVSAPHLHRPHDSLWEAPCLFHLENSFKAQFQSYPPRSLPYPATHSLPQRSRGHTPSLTLSVPQGDLLPHGNRKVSDLSAHFRCRETGTTGVFLAFCAWHCAWCSG